MIKYLEQKLWDSSNSRVAYFDFWGLGPKKHNRRQEDNGDETKHIDEYYALLVNHNNSCGV